MMKNTLRRSNHHPNNKLNNNLHFLPNHSRLLDFPRDYFISISQATNLAKLIAASQFVRFKQANS